MIVKLERTQSNTYQRKDKHRTPTNSESTTTELFFVFLKKTKHQKQHPTLIRFKSHLCQRIQI